MFAKRCFRRTVLAASPTSWLLQIEDTDHWWPSAVYRNDARVQAYVASNQHCQHTTLRWAISQPKILTDSMQDALQKLPRAGFFRG